MSEKDNKQPTPFAEEYWKEEGGEKWVEYIDATEASLAVFREKLIDYASVAEGEIILDVGCGGGTTSIDLASRVGPGGRVTGVDISAPILSLAKKRGERIDNLDFIEDDAASCELDEKAFNLIFSRFGVMFFSDPVAAFSNFRQSITPCGRIVFLCWRTLEENPWMGAPTAAAFQVIPPQGPPPEPDMPGPFSLSSKKRITSLLRSAGLNNVNIEAVDVDMCLGDMDETVDYFSKMGPAAAILVNATEDQKNAVKEAMREALKQFETAEGIVAPAAAWIVTARP